MFNFLKRRRRQHLVDVLKSRRFKRGKGCLRRFKDGKYYYCPLGIACMLHSQKFFGKKWRKVDNLFTYMGESAYMPAKVRKYYGFSKEDTERITKLNDEGFLNRYQLADEVAKMRIT
jgi:hypothetical protein